MRKLAQNDLQAMACRLYQNLVKQAEIAQDQLNAIQDRENAKKVTATIKEAREFDKAFKALTPATRKFLSKRFDCYGMKLGKLTGELDPEQLVKNMRKDQITVKVPSDPTYDRYTSELFYDLTIAQIDSDNVDDLLNKVASRYIKRPGTGVTK